MKIALVQSSLIWGDVDGNLRNFDAKLSQPQGCDVILLPEMFASGCMMVKRSFEVAEAEKMTVAGRYTEICGCMRKWAERQGGVVMGSTVCGEEGQYYNRLVAAFPDGRYLYYDKRHCFRVGGEDEHFSAGDKRLVFEFRGVRIAAFICYDLRFPVWSRNVEGYDLAVYVANWPESRREVWNVLLRARAIENQAYVAGVNCVGVDNNGLKYCGDSVLVDERGGVTGEGDMYEEGIVVAEMDVERLRLLRKKFPVLDDRDVFRIGD